MRENRFRYTVIKGSGHVMVETFPLGDIENGRVVTWLKVNHASDDTCEIHVDQFTGLTDKNGVEIFEGDIIEGSDRQNRHWVSYCSNEARFIACHIPTLEYSDGCSLTAEWVAVCGKVIIGNIHEQPELIKEI